MAREKKRKGRSGLADGSSALALPPEGDKSQPGSLDDDGEELPETDRGPEVIDPAAKAPAPAAEGKLAVAPAADPNATMKIRAAAPASLASRVADAAAAQLLLFDTLPGDERPRPNDRVLLVGLVWGNKTLIELEQVSRGGDLAAGKLFDLPAVALQKNFQIVRHVGSELVLTAPADLPAEVHGPKGHQTLAELCTQQKAQLVQAPFKGYSYTVGNDDRIVVQIGTQLTLIARYVRAARQPDKSWWDRLDVAFATTLLIGLLALFFFYIAVKITPPPDVQIGDEMRQNQNRFTKFAVKPPPEPPKKIKDLAGIKEGARAKGDEGKIGKKDAVKKEAAPSKKGSPNFDKKKHDLQVINNSGLVQALNKLKMAGSSAVSDTFGPGGLGIGNNSNLGGSKPGAGAGDAYGVAGMGSRGVGPGGGGTALGIGGLGTKGNGKGRGGYGEVDLGGRGAKDETRFIPGKTTVIGGLPREVINRIIQRHYNEIKYCYEKELVKDPGLYGKVTVLFVIDGGGKVADALVQQTTMASEPVETCILNHVKRWQFPSPQGGGTVQVTYPYVFKSTGN